MRSFWLSLSFSALAWAQTANIQGTAVDSVTGQPVPRAHVSLNGEKRYDALSTADGKFSMGSIAPGEYTPSAERVGYVEDPHPSSFMLQVDEKKTDVTVKLVPTGAIIGRVLDSEGEPVEGAQVVAEGGNEALTDDKGRFRIGGLQPGRYRVRAKSSVVSGSPPEIRTDGSEEVYDALTYFPGRVRVAPSVEVNGIDIHLVRAPILSVSGRVTGVAPGTERASVTARAVSGGDQREVRIRKDGTFKFWKLDPGKYFIFVRADGTGSDDIGSAAVPVQVAGSNIEGIELRLAHTADLPGRLEFDDDKAKQSPQMLIRLSDPATIAASESAAVDANGAFVLKNVAPGVYHVDLTANGVYVKSLRYGSTIVDGSILDLSYGVAGGDLSILLSSAVDTISGTVKDDHPAGTRVALVPADGSRTRFGAVKPDGSYSFEGLAPGSYKLVAMPDLPPGAPAGYEDVMEPVEIHAGDKVIKDLKLSVAPF